MEITTTEKIQAIDTGDSVKHIPTGQTWLVACVRDNRLSWIGWPEGWADLADCVLIEKVASEIKRKLLEDMAAMNRTEDHRCRYARMVLGK